MGGADNRLWYFAYGSNMQRATFVGRREMRPMESSWGRLDDFELCFDLPVGPGERGVANITRRAGASVHGVLHLISAIEADRLDRTEGVHRGLYDRLAVDIMAADGAAVAAFTYCSRHGTSGRKASPRYMGLLLEGAREHGLPVSYQSYLVALPLAVDEREPSGD